MISEMKDNFRGLTKTPTAPQEIIVKPPDTEYIFDVCSSLNKTNYRLMHDLLPVAL